MNALTSALDVLTAMITPAVLISACGTLILSTSTRLGRVIDRVRVLSDRFEELAHAGEEIELLEERRMMIFNQFDKLIKRAHILQQCLTVFYMAAGIFVSTSVAVGIVAVSGSGYSWVPVVMGLGGACFLFYGCVMLIFEARMALNTLRAEMDFIRQLGRHYAPAELVKRRKSRRLSFGRHHD
jgi:hypothetical protein